MRLVYEAALGVELPAWDTVPSTAGAAVHAAAREERRGWLKIPPGRERPLDVMLIYRWGYASHVGVIVRRGRLLHVDQPDPRHPGSGTSHVERYAADGQPFRIAGIYRLSAS